MLFYKHYEYGEGYAMIHMDAIVHIPTHILELLNHA